MIYYTFIFFILIIFLFFIILIIKEYLIYKTFNCNYKIKQSDYLNILIYGKESEDFIILKILIEDNFFKPQQILNYNLLENIYSHTKDIIGYIYNINDKIVFIFKGVYKFWEIECLINYKNINYNGYIVNAGCMHIFKESNIESYINKYKNKNIIFSGYSLGACFAYISSIYFNQVLKKENYQTYLFALPKFSYYKYLKNINCYISKNDFINTIYQKFFFQFYYVNPKKTFLLDYKSDCYINNHSLFFYYKGLEKLKKNIFYYI